MKKILFLIIAGCLGLVSTSQTLFPSTQGYATPTTLFNPRGGVMASTAFIVTTFADTTAANAANPYTKSYAGSMIFCTSDTSLNYRSVGANRWIKISGGNGNGSGGGGGGGNVLSLTNGLTLTSGVGYWGGPLVQNTLITGAGYKLRFDGLDSFTVRYGTTKRIEIGAVSTLISSPDYLNYVSVLNNGINLVTTSGNGVVVRDTSVTAYQNIYLPSLTAGVSTDSILVFNATTKRLYYRSPSAYGGGSVLSFSSGNLSPLFTTSVANSTTNPTLSFALSTAAAKTVYWNNQSITATPAFNYLDTSAFGGTGQWNTYVLNNSKLFAVGDSRAAETRYFSGGNAYNITLDSIQLVVKGVYGTGQTVPAYADAQMFFNPRKAAFRAGVANNSQWIDANVGPYSTAFGSTTTASGNYSFSAGISNMATETASVALGNGNVSSGSRSFTMGLEDTATGYVSSAMGAYTTSYGWFGSTFGRGTTNNTWGGFVIGHFNDSSYNVNPNYYAATGRAFQIGNGTDYTGSRSNAMTVLFNGETVIGGHTRDSSALLKLKSTTKGFLTSVMTGTQMNAVVTPSTGLLIYNTDSTAFCYYNGVIWVKIGTGSGGVGSVVSVASGNGMNFSTITGTGTVTLGTPSSVTLASTNSLTSNSHTHAFTPGGTSSQVILGDGTLGTYNGGNAWLLATNTANAGTDRFGTSNNVSLRILTNATERMVVDSNGRVGIGTVAPNVSSLLHISSTTKGFLKPVVTGVQMNAISTPATGLEVYNTDSIATCYYNGSAWIKVSAASAGAAGTVTSVATGYGTLGGTITTSGTVRFDSATVFPQLLNTISLTTAGSSGVATWNPTTRILNIPEYQSGSSGGTVTNVIAGNGMDFSPITTTGTVTLGTPSSISFTSTNSASTATHTHALTFPSTADSVILGNGTRGIYLRNAWVLNGNAATAGTDRLGTTNNTSLRILTNAIERMVLDSNGRIGIGTVAPNSTAKLDVTSTTQGILMPRLTGIQQAAISSPATGLIIYNTDSVAFCYYNGAVWVKIGAATGGGGGGGSGTITSLLHGYGIINTPNPITSTGTIKADTASMFPAVISTVALTTVGTSGVATWNPTTRILNIPQYIGGGGGSGFTTLGPIGSSPNANGASSSGVTLNLEPASIGYGGVVTMSNQVLGGGYKTFVKDITVDSITVGIGSRTTLGISYSTAVGKSALLSNTTGHSNTAIGAYSLTNNTTGYTNTGVGYNTLRYNTTGTDNTAIGAESLVANTTGAANTAIGKNALLSTTTGNSNTGIGSSSLVLITTGSNNLGMGSNAGGGITTGSNNIAFGYGPMIYTTGGVTGNIAIGTATLLNTRTNNQIAIGGNALTYNTTGEGNVAIGESSLSTNTSGGFNTAVGSNTLDYNTSGSFNVAMGTSALLFNTSGARNVAIGVQTLLFNTGGDQNVAVGTNALLFNTSGQKNIAVGPGASENNTTGSLNVALGQDALLRTTTGSGNVGIGWNAMATTVTSSNNVAVGYGAGKTVLLGPNNVFMGRDAGWNASQNDSITGSIAIGHSSYTTKDSLAVFGASYIKETWLRGKTGVSVENPDSVLQVSGGFYTNRGVRHTNLPTTAQARVAMIGTDGTMYSADTTGLFSGGGGGSKALSAITAGVATNDINSGNYAQAWRWNSLTTQTAFTWSSSSITTGKLFDIQLTGTHTMGGQVGFNVATTQVNGDAPGFGTNYAAKISNGTTAGTAYTNYGLLTEAVGTGGTSVENVGLVAKATGGTTNYAAQFTRGTVSFGTVGTESGLTEVNGSTSGTISFKVQAAAGTYNWNHPITAGTSNQVLTSQGGGSTAMIWTTPTTGTVTSVGSGYGITGGAITSTGTLIADTATLFTKLFTTLSLTTTGSGASTWTPATRILNIPSAWALAGNAATAGVDFLGTTNNTSLRIRSNNTERMVVDSNGRVGIGTTVPNVSALLDISSTTKGALVPRLTGVQQAAVSTPATGLLIYNTDSTAFCYYNGAAWIKIGAAAGGGGGTVTSVATGYGVTGGTITTTGTIVADTATLFTKLLTTVALTTSGSGAATWTPATRILNIPTPSTAYVTSVATGYGITGGTITSTGTLVTDTATLFTKIFTTLALTTTGSGAATWTPATRILNVPTPATITASNGLTKTVNDITLGGALIQATTISGSTSYGVSFTGNYATGTNAGVVMATQSSASGRAIYGYNSSGTGGVGVYGEVGNSGTAVSGVGTTGNGVSGYVTSGLAVRAEATTGTSLYTTTTSGLSAQIGANPASTSSVTNLLQIYRTSSGTAADGIGGSIDFYNQTASGVTSASNTLISQWSTAANATRTSQFILTGVNSGATADLFGVAGSGRTRLNKYGVGTFVAGTPTYDLQVDASGNIMEKPFAAAVTAVTGTSSRITSTGGTTPVIDISGSYVGQSSITTLGTITTGTWNGTSIGDTYGGTGQTTVTTGDLLYGSAANTWSKLADVAVGSYLRSGGVGTAPLWSTLILPNSSTANRVVYSTSTNTYGESGQFTFSGQALQLGSTNTTETTTSSILAITPSALTTGTGIYEASSTLTSGKLVHLVVTGTAADANQTALNISLSGANATSSIATFGAILNNAHTGTSANNTGLYAVTSGGATNTGIYGEASGTAATNNYGGYFIASAASATNNTGVYATAQNTGTNNVGLIALATSGGTNYAAKFTRGKVLFGTTGTESGVLEITGATSGTITLQPSAAAGTYNWNFPTTAGTANQVLTSQGGGSTAMTWTTPSTSVAWSSITNPTTTQALTFDAGETTTWTNSNTTGTLLTVNSASRTSGGVLLLASSSGSLSIGTKVLDIDITGNNSTTVIGENISIVNAAAGSTNIGLQVSTTSGTINYAAQFNRGKVSVGTAGTETGIIEFNGSTSGTVTLKTAAAAGTTNFIFPTAYPTNNGQFLLGSYGGGGSTSWVNPLDYLNVGCGLTITHNFDGNGAVEIKLTTCPEPMPGASDERLKNISGNYTGGLNELMKLKTINYSWNNISGRDTLLSHVGFSAQNIKEVLPEAVTTNKEGYYALEDRAVIALLVNSVQQLKKEIEILKSKK